MITKIRLKQKEFCRLTGLTRKSLLIYEKKKLLMPSYIDSNTMYRYYGQNELIRGSKISFLRGLGFNIEEIKSLLKGINNNELLHQKKLDLAREYQKTIHGFKFIYLMETFSTNFYDELQEKKFSPGSIISLEGRGEARDIRIHFSLLNNHIKKYGISISGVPFTYFYSDTSAKNLHFKVCQPIFGNSYTSPDNNFLFESFAPVQMYYLTHYGNYELLNLKYKILKEKLRYQRKQTTGEFIEIYQNIALYSTIKDSSTRITDIGAILC